MRKLGSIKTVFWIFVIALVFQLTSFSASAQLQPRVSPWLGMSDRSRGAGMLGSYLSNVRPQQDMMRAYAAQASQIQAQQRTLQELQRVNSSGGGGVSVGGNLTGPGGPSVGGSVLGPPREIVRANKNPAGFNQYLHYYPPGSLPSRPVPNFSQPGRRF